MTEITARLSTALADRYMIERELGAGGMATVYLAEDLKLHRKVAIKVLRPALAAILGAERFLGEVRVTANLQHPHIIPLHDSGQADGFLYYVMPYVDGEALREKLTRDKQLGVEEAIKITEAVAAALDYAHEHGVIHRDIKPENILLHAGQAVVADFGIALAVTAAGGARLTETGLSLGTPEYMSPEQAGGERELTERTDIYSLGAVTYEMLTGRAPHTGATAQAIIAKVVSRTPEPMKAGRPSIPGNVEAAVEKALAKVPGDRFSRATDFSGALTNVGFTRTLNTAPPEVSARIRKWKQLALASISFAMVVIALGIVQFSRVPGPRAPVWTSLELARYQGSGFAQPFDLAPDGSAVVFVGRPVPGMNDRFGPLTIRRFDAAVPRELGTLSMVGVFSPDGNDVAGKAGDHGTLWTTPADGGGVTTLIRRGPFSDPAWGDDGFIYGHVGGPFSQGGLVRIAEDGGEPELLTAVDSARGEFNHKFVDVVAGGVLFTSWWRDSSRIMAYSFGTKSVSRLAAGSTARYLPDGYLLFGTLEGRLQAQRFDPQRLEVTGVPTDLIDSVMVLPYGRVQFDVAANGTLIYEPQWERQPRSLVLLDSLGEERLLPFGPGAYGSPRLSPDGRMVAYSRTVTGGAEIWVHDAEGRRWRVASGGGNYFPTWSPDGAELVYSSNRVARWEMYRTNANGSGAAQALFQRDSGAHPISWAPDGTILFWASPNTISLVSRGGTGEIRVAVPGCERLCGAEAGLSPDGSFIGYRDGQDLWVAELANPVSNRQQVAAGGVVDWHPRWSPDGRELYYVADDGQLMAVSVQLGEQLSVGAPRALVQVFDRRFVFSGSANPVFDVDPLGRGFVFVREGLPPPALRVVFNFDELVRTRLEN